MDFDSGSSTENSGRRATVTSKSSSPMTYPGSVALVAILATIIALSSFFLFEPKVAIISGLLGGVSLAIAISDARHLIVPDVLSLPAIPAGLVVTGLLADSADAHLAVLEHLSAATFGAAVLYAIRQFYFHWRDREGLGLGDVKLAAVAGAWTGLQGFSSVLLLSCVLAISCVCLAHLLKRRPVTRSTAVPFGVFLAPSIWIVWAANILGLDFGLALLTSPP